MSSKLSSYEIELMQLESRYLGRCTHCQEYTNAFDPCCSRGVVVDGSIINPDEAKKVYDIEVSFLKASHGKEDNE